MLALAASIAGCGGDSDISPSAASIDLNAAISTSSTEDIATLPGASTVFGLPNASLNSAIDPSQCAFTPSSQSFVCPPQTSHGLTFNLAYTLLDASGQSQSSLNAATTSAVHTLVDVNGSTPVDGTTFIAAIHHHGDFTLSGLQSTTRTLNGSSHDRDTVTSASGSPVTRSVIDATSATANVVIASGSRFPESGTITANVTTSTTFGSTPAVTATAHAVVTFDGTNIAIAVVTVAGSTRRCQIDLNGGIPRCSNA